MPVSIFMPVSHRGRFTTEAIWLTQYNILFRKYSIKEK